MLGKKKGQGHQHDIENQLRSLGPEGGEPGFW
jgi:hypothetical protein